MNLRFAGKKAFITGASRGIGRAIARAMRAEGAWVIGTYTGERQPGEESAQEWVRADFTDIQQLEACTASVRRSEPDVLVNNAGIFIAKPITKYSETDFAAILGVNLAGFFHITQLAIAEMEKRHSGHVVQITTSLIEHANSHVPSVLASLTKGGLSAATKSLAIEYAKRGIRVNAVAPGVIKTPMHPVETHAQLAKLHPLGRMGEISDIVGAILYLESAGFVTGETIHVDGGQGAGH